MPRTKPTQHAIATLQAPTATGRQIPYWDTDLTGFGVLCSGKTSAKSFIVQRDLPGGKSRRVTIANVSELKFADAKDRARREGPEGEAAHRHFAGNFRPLSGVGAT